MLKSLFSLTGCRDSRPFPFVIPSVAYAEPYSMYVDLHVTTSDIHLTRQLTSEFSAIDCCKVSLVSTAHHWMSLQMSTTHFVTSFTADCTSESVGAITMSGMLNLISTSNWTKTEVGSGVDHSDEDERVEEADDGRELSWELKPNYKVNRLNKHDNLIRSHAW